jgi:hypothetical protein
MSTLNDLTNQLTRIQQRIVAHPVFGRGTGVPVDDPGYAREADELERMSAELNLVIRNVSSHLHLLSAKKRGLWSVPRDRRYSAAASVDQQQLDSDRLLRTATDVRRLLDELMRRNGRVSDGDIADKVGEFIKQWHETHSHHGVHSEAPTGAPSYLPPGHFQASPEAATIAVYAALRALAYFLRKRSDRAA